MSDWIACGLIFAGTLFCVLAAVGLLRMPDLYMRIQAAAKSSTLGVSCLVLASVIQFEATGVTTRALLVIAFLFLTAPIAAHILGRAAYSSGVPLWKNTVVDELGQAEGELARTRGEANQSFQTPAESRNFPDNPIGT